MRGWFRCWREMWDHAVWSLPAGQRCVWLTCLKMANHQASEWWDGRERVEIRVGSFITSQDHLAKSAKVSRKIVRCALTNLERIGSIRAKIRANKWTLIEIVNWPIYQGVDEEAGQEVGQVRANQGPTEGHNGRMKEGKKKNSSANGLPPGFAVWWEEYPKKVGKIQAVKEWEKLDPDNALQAVMLDALRKQRHTVKAMVENDRHHIQDPERWIKYHRWEDELGAAPNSGQEYPAL